MRTIETKNLIFEDYTDISYFSDLVFYVDEHETEILNFFKMPKLQIKWKVLILTFEDFKNTMIKYYGYYKDFMAGHSKSSDKTIRILNVEDQIKYTKHKDSTIEKLKKQIIHEFVHACYSETVGYRKETHWFNEGLATYLSHQDRDFEDISNIDFNLLKTDFNKFGSYGYTCSYLIVKYLFKNYSKDEIDKLVFTPDYLIEKTDDIFSEAKEWIKQQINSRN